MDELNNFAYQNIFHGNSNRVAIDWDLSPVARSCRVAFSLQDHVSVNKLGQTRKLMIKQLQFR